MSRHLGLSTGAHAVLLQRRLDGWIRNVPTWCSTIFSKLSIPPFGAQGLSLAIPMLTFTSVMGLATGRLVVDRGILTGWLLIVAFLWFLQLFSTDVFSVSSLLMFTVLHFSYVVRLKKKPDYDVVIAGFQKMAMFIAFLGISQYTIQFFIGSTYAFPIENFFPEAFKVSLFNMQGRLEYGVEVYRTNGVFMLEPSFYSQLLAIAIVIEAIYQRRLWVFAFFTVGILVAFSGTGFMVLAACVPCLAIVKKRWGLLVAGIISVVGLFWFATWLDNEYLNVFLKRSGEFTSKGSSGFARFVGGFYMFEEFLWPEPARALLGFGAGSLQKYMEKATYASGGNVFFKTFFEFGVIGGVAYFSFMIYCFSRCSAPIMLRIAVAITYWLGGSYIPFSHALAFGLLFWPNADFSEKNKAVNV